MRIAQVAPLWETIPPRSYGGTELVVHLLTESLVQQGHEVTLFASGGSQTTATLHAGSDYPLRDLKEHFPQFASAESFYPGSTVSFFYELQMLEKLFAQADQFDVIHNHLSFVTLPFASFTKTPVVTTLHGAFKDESIQECVERQYFESFAHLPYVSISDAQRVPCPSLNYVETVYHGLDTTKYEPSYTFEDKQYLAFLGRFCPEKGPQHAIRIAKETGWKLIMAGKVDHADEKAFFEAEIQPHLGDQIQYIGELNHEQKAELLRNAAATLCPVTWREPFGLVLTESMACGTPVFAMPYGSIPELIVHGKTGFVMPTVEGLIECVAKLPSLNRKDCRQHVETHFSIETMTRDYLKVYQRLIDGVAVGAVKKPLHRSAAMAMEDKHRAAAAKKVTVLTPKERIAQ